MAGLNIKINYVGYDNYSQVTAVVNFDLKLNPTSMSFKVDCLNRNKMCKQEEVESIYKSIEAILMFHPELFAFRLIDVKVLQSITAHDKIRVMLTFENTSEKMRCLLEEEII